VGDIFSENYTTPTKMSWNCLSSMMLALQYIGVPQDVLGVLQESVALIEANLDTEEMAVVRRLLKYQSGVNFSLSGLKRPFAKTVTDIMTVPGTGAQGCCQRGWNDEPLVSMLKKRGITKFMLKDNGRTVWTKTAIVSYDDNGYICTGGVLPIFTAQPASKERNILNSMVGLLPIYKLNFLNKEDRFKPMSLMGVSLPPRLLSSSILFMHTMHKMQTELQSIGMFDDRLDMAKLEANFYVMMARPAVENKWASYLKQQVKETGEALSFFPLQSSVQMMLEWSRRVRGGGRDLAADFTKQSTPTHFNHFSEVLSKHVRAIGPFDDGKRTILFVGCMEVNVSVVQKENWIMTDYKERAGASFVYDAMEDDLPEICTSDTFVVCDGYLDDEHIVDQFGTRDANATIPFLRVFSKMLEKKRIKGFAVKVFMFGEEAERAVTQYTQFEHVVSTIGGRPHNGERFIRCSGEHFKNGKQFVQKVKGIMLRDVRFYNDLRMKKIFQLLPNTRTEELTHDAISSDHGELTLIEENFLLGDYFIDSAKNLDTDQVEDEAMCSNDNKAAVQATKERMRATFPEVDFSRNNGPLSHRRSMLRNISSPEHEHVAYDLAGVARARDQKPISENHWYNEPPRKSLQGIFNREYDLDCDFDVQEKPVLVAKKKPKGKIRDPKAPPKAPAQ